MNFSHHPKYESIALKVKDFIEKNDMSFMNTNIIIGGDGSLFTYASFNQPNLLICSEKHSRGFYASCWFEDDYKSFLIDYFHKPFKFHKKLSTIEVLINGTALPERAINDVILGRDYNFKAGVNEEIVHTTGLLFYTPDGWSGWAHKFGALQFYHPGFVDLDTGASLPLISDVEINVLPFHSFDIVFDGKGRNLERSFNTSTSNKDVVYNHSWSAEEGDNIIIREGEPAIIVQQDLKTD